MKAYLYIHKGMPVASLTEKPELYTVKDYISKALKEYKANLMELENSSYINSENRTVISIEDTNTIHNHDWHTEVFVPGQQVEIEITENGCKVKSLIN